MQLQMIDVGVIANDGTGDDLREAFIKINQNFQSLEGVVSPTAINLGTAGAEVFARISEDGVFEFRRIVAGNGMTITQLENTIEFQSTSAPTNFIVTSDNGSLIVENSTLFTIRGANGVTTTANENTKTLTVGLGGNIQISGINDIDWENTLGAYLSFDFGFFTESPKNLIEYIIQTIGVDMGSFTSPNPLELDAGSFM